MARPCRVNGLPVGTGGLRRPRRGDPGRVAGARRVAAPRRSGSRGCAARSGATARARYCPGRGPRSRRCRRPPRPGRRGGAPPRSPGRGTRPRTWSATRALPIGRRTCADYAAIRGLVKSPAESLSCGPDDDRPNGSTSAGAHDARHRRRVLAMSSWGAIRASKTPSPVADVPRRGSTSRAIADGLAADPVGDTADAPASRRSMRVRSGRSTRSPLVGVLAVRRGPVSRRESPPSRAPPDRAPIRLHLLPARPVPHPQIPLDPPRRWSNRPWSARARPAPEASRAQCTPHNPNTGEQPMRLLSIAIASALVGICGGPALAGECPMLQTQMEQSGQQPVRQRRLHGAGEHEAGLRPPLEGKHADSVAKYEEAAKARGRHAGPQEVSGPSRRRGRGPGRHVRGAALPGRMGVG